MATPAWNIAGQYFETCSCEFICPCITGRMAARPTNGSCTFAMTMQIERGSFGDVALDGLCFIVVGYAPAEMGKGNWSVGLVIDERATRNSATPSRQSRAALRAAQWRPLRA
jgi:hypothetical protein